MKIEISLLLRDIFPGEELQAKVNLFNLGKAEKVNVDMEYLIKDMQGNEILTERESVIVEKELELSKTFKLPENIVEGEYLLYVKAEYENKIASSSVFFRVVKEELKTTILIIFTVALLILIILIIFEIKKIKKHLKKNIRVEEKDILNHIKNKKRIKWQ